MVGGRPDNSLVSVWYLQKYDCRYLFFFFSNSKRCARAFAIMSEDIELAMRTGTGLKGS